MADMLLFPPAFQTAEAKDQVIEWVRSWPFPLEAKKSALALWAKTFSVDLTRADWLRAIPEEA